MKPKKTTRITVSLADDEYASLSDLAEKHDVSLSWLTRKAVVEFLKEYGEGRGQLALDLPMQQPNNTRVS